MTRVDAIQIDDFNLEFFQGDILTRTNLIVKLGLLLIGGGSRIFKKGCYPTSKHVFLFSAISGVMFFCRRKGGDMEN